MDNATVRMHILSCTFLPDEMRTALLLLAEELPEDGSNQLLKKLDAMAFAECREVQSFLQKLMGIDCSCRKGVRENRESIDRSSEHLPDFDA